MNPKGYPFAAMPTSGWDLFGPDAVYPIAVLKASAIEHNTATMMGYCRRNGVSLAPHGKTTMAPGLFRRQMEDGAWAITAASVWQAAVMRHHGIERVFIGNEVVVPAEIRWLSDAVAEGFSVSCYVDSLAGVAIMEEVLGELAGDRPPLPVLVEVGADGSAGRAGVRTVEDGLAIAEAVRRSSHLRLDGVSAFEGILGADGHRTAAEVVGTFLDKVVDLVHRIDAEGWFEGPEVVVSAGGSAYFDHVVERFAAVSVSGSLRKVVRSGCYLTHDDGGYHRSSPMGETPRVDTDERFVPAIEIWAPVLSRPEPTRAIVGFGKRDATHEGILPVAKYRRRRGGTTIEVIPPNRPALMNDQHAFLDVAADDDLAVGDLLGFGISHPCLTFDKWRSVLLVDDDHRVVEVLETWF